MRCVGAVAAVTALLAVFGCSSGSSGDRSARPTQPDTSKRAARLGSREAAIRDWSKALNAGSYGKAASFFARGAIVEQTQEIRLADRSAAVAFNRSLPCRAQVTDVEDEGPTVLAAFRLRDGPGGRCSGGNARVRFRFKGGKFSEWRQLAEPPAPQGPIA